MYYCPSFIPKLYKRNDVPIEGLVSTLCEAPLYQHKKMLGENMYPLINKLEHKHGHKVTEMILELDTTEVLYLLESPKEFKLVVDEAMDVLRNAFVSALVNAPRHTRKKNRDMNSDVITVEIDDTITMVDTNNITAISSPIIELSLTEELKKQVTEPTSDGRPEKMVKDTNDMLHMVQKSTLQDAKKRVSFATIVVTENTHQKVNFRKVEEDVARVDNGLDNGPWMIRQVPIILNKWPPSTCLTKENHYSVPIWVKMHKVPMAAIMDDMLSFISSKTPANVRLVHEYDV
nr:polyadenylate-binding protein 2-like [Tanacetum cinerariifolium]